MMKLPLLAVSTLLLSACGGRVIETGPDGSGGAEVDPPSTPSSAGSDQPSTPVGGAHSRPLEACKPGFSQAMFPSRPCNWVSEGEVCFDTKDLACNCLCPSDRDSVCLSGFYNGLGMATLVRCI